MKRPPLRWRQALGGLIALRLLASSATVLAATAPTAATPAARFERGNLAYDQKRYAEAEDEFFQLVADGVDGGWVLYNLGNSCLRQGKLGAALAAYRASAARLPRQSDVQHNLAFAQRQARDALPPMPTPAGLSNHELLLLVLAAHGMFFTALTLHRLRAFGRRWRPSCTLLCLLWLGSCSWALLRLLSTVPLLVIAAEEAEVHSGTSYDTVLRFMLHAGSEARIVDQKGNWLRIELVDGKQGWVARQDVALVLP